MLLGDREALLFRRCSGNRKSDQACSIPSIVALVTQYKRPCILQLLRSHSVRREVYKKFKGLEMDTCPICLSAGEEADPVGIDQGRDEKLCVAQTSWWHKSSSSNGRQWSFEHSKFVGLREDKEAREVVREG